MEERRTKYFSVLKNITKELFQKNIPNHIVSFTASRFSEVFNDKLHYAFIHRRANKIIWSTTDDNIIQSILPFFLNDKFIEEIDKLDWSALEIRMVHLLTDREPGVNGAGVSGKKDLKPVETAGAGFDISASWKNDFLEVSCLI